MIYLTWGRGGALLSLNCSCELHQSSLRDYTTECWNKNTAIIGHTLCFLLHTEALETHTHAKPHTHAAYILDTWETLPDRDIFFLRFGNKSASGWKKNMKKKEGERERGLIDIYHLFGSESVRVRVPLRFLPAAFRVGAKAFKTPPRGPGWEAGERKWERKDRAKALHKSPNVFFPPLSNTSPVFSFTRHRSSVPRHRLLHRSSSIPPLFLSLSSTLL